MVVHRNKLVLWEIYAKLLKKKKNSDLNVVTLSQNECVENRNVYLSSLSSCYENINLKPTWIIKLLSSYIKNDKLSFLFICHKSGALNLIICSLDIIWTKWTPSSEYTVCTTMHRDTRIVSVVKHNFFFKSTTVRTRLENNASVHVKSTVGFVNTKGVTRPRGTSVLIARYAGGHGANETAPCVYKVKNESTSVGTTEVPRGGGAARRKWTNDSESETETATSIQQVSLCVRERLSTLCSLSFNRPRLIFVNFIVREKTPVYSRLTRCTRATHGAKAVSSGTLVRLEHTPPPHTPHYRTNARWNASDRTMINFTSILFVLVRFKYDPCWRDARLNGML